jgi:hypothetical protein
MVRVSSAGRRRLMALAVTLWAALAAIAPGRAQPSPGPVAIPNGTWTVQGREIPGTRCGNWLVRLTSRDGNLSGVVSLARASVPLENLVAQPDGSFSGATRPGVVGSTHARPYRVTGRFTGDTVHLTLETYRCPLRQGSSTRH